MTEHEFRQVGRAGLSDPGDTRLQAAVVKRALDRRFRGEMTYRRKDGTRFEGEVTSVVLDDGGHAFVIVRDITERICG
jgi:PAS domain S-box-containing protein